MSRFQGNVLSVKVFGGGPVWMEESSLSDSEVASAEIEKNRIGKLIEQWTQISMAVS